MGLIYEVDIAHQLRFGVYVRQHDMHGNSKQVLMSLRFYNSHEKVGKNN